MVPQIIPFRHRFNFMKSDWNGYSAELDTLIEDVEPIPAAPYDPAYMRWSCHSALKLLCKLCRTSPPPAMGSDLSFFGHAGHADPVDG